MAIAYAGLLAGVAVLLLLGGTAFRRRAALAAWWRRAREARRRVVAEDALKHLHACGLRGHTATPDSLAGALRLSPRAMMALVARLEAQGWLRSGADGLTLTEDGARLALQVIRAHRLWERYLADEARMPFRKLHAEAELREHTRSTEDLDALDAAMGFPAIDPHGDPIPDARGELTSLSACALPDWPIDKPARIVHLEDEPPAVFARIAVTGMRPGHRIRIVEADAARIVVARGDHTHTLTPVEAANIFVSPVEALKPQAPARRLSTLAPGARATVRALDDDIRGLTRRRLLDLGMTPGVTVTAEMRGVFRDPVAYRVRGSLIALRRDQAQHVLIETHGTEVGADA